jgi:hypothetical protein
MSHLVLGKTLEGNEAQEGIGRLFGSKLVPQAIRIRCWSKALRAVKACAAAPAAASASKLIVLGRATRNKRREGNLAQTTSPRDLAAGESP